MTAILGVERSDASMVYHDYIEANLQGDDGHRFRFNYSDPSWIDGFLFRLDAVRDPPNVIGFPIKRRGWPEVHRSVDFESYRFNATPYDFKRLTVDRKLQLVFVELFDH